MHVEVSHCLISKFTYKSIVIKVCYGPKNIGQQSKLMSSEINPYIYSQMIFDKVVKIIQWKNGSFPQVSEE